MRVLFLPGAGGDGRFWQPLDRLLPADWDKVFFDWPGLGAVPATPDVNGFDDLVRRVLAALDGPVDLVAQSMGGVVALRVALERPDLVRRLVLVATSGGVDMKRFGAGDWRAEYARRFPAARTWIIEQRPDLTDRLAEICASWSSPAGPMRSPGTAPPTWRPTCGSTSLDRPAGARCFPSSRVNR